MNKILYITLLLFLSLFAKAQNPNGNYNPYVNTGIISPTPLWPTNADGTGIASFNIGNAGSDPLTVYPDQYITLTITLSFGEPNYTNPFAAIGGTLASHFSWRYNEGTYTALQITDIQANSSGTITIDYKVTENSGSPGLNGFNVNISPAPYQTESNSQNDDAVSSYTFTEIRDFGDAPESYGSAFHILDFENYLGSIVDGEVENQASDEADGDDQNGYNDDDGVVFPKIIQQGEILAIPVTVTGMGQLYAWFDWNADGDFEDADEKVADLPRLEGTMDLSVEVPNEAVINVPTYARFRFVLGTLESSTGFASSGEVEDYRITISVTPKVPTVPKNVSVITVLENSVTISWDASIDDVSVEAYNIYRDGEFFDVTTELSYIDNTVNIGDSFTYAISAIDEEDNESAVSLLVTAIILDLTPPSVPAGLILDSVTDFSVSLAWMPSTDNIGVIWYNVYRLGFLLETVTGLKYTDNTLLSDSSYSYSISAIDSAKNESERSLEVIAMPGGIDTESPSIPNGLMAISATRLGLSLIWNSSSDNVGVEGYRVYKDGVLFSTEHTPSTSDVIVDVGNSYSYSVSAFDLAGNESEQSDTLTITIVSDFQIVNNIAVAPNPSNGLFTIDMNEESGRFTLEVNAADGVLLIQRIVDLDGSLLTMNFENLNEGLYYFRVYNTDRIYYCKLMIVK